MSHPAHSRAAVPKETEQSGDVLNGSFHSSSGNHGNAADAYYKYMLLKEKLTARTDANVPAVLRATSEKEDIEYEILQTLVGITESSPEFAQIVSLTGTHDRFDQARILAEAVYDKMRAEQILSFYTPDRNALEQNFYVKTAASALQRTNRVATGLARVRGDLVGDFVQRIFGGVAAPPARP